jgi:hypothetical protein
MIKRLESLKNAVNKYMAVPVRTEAGRKSTTRCSDEYDRELLVCKNMAKLPIRRDIPWIGSKMKNSSCLRLL